MKKKIIIKYLLLLLGLTPFIVPIAWGVFATIIIYSVDLSLFDFFSFYSFLYWPTYIIGIILIIISICIKTKKANSSNKN